MISFVDVGPPVTTNMGYKTAIRGGRPCFVLTKAGEDYKNRLAAQAQLAHAKSCEAPIEDGAVVAVRFVFPSLATDSDGPLKFVLDAVGSGSRGHAGAGIVLNDNRVRRVVIVKADPDGEPRTEVAVGRIGEGACPTCGCSCATLLNLARSTPRPLLRTSAAAENALTLLTTRSEPQRRRRAQVRCVSSVRRPT